MYIYIYVYYIYIYIIIIHITRELRWWRSPGSRAAAAPTATRSGPDIV